MTNLISSKPSDNITTNKKQNKKHHNISNRPYDKIQPYGIIRAFSVAGAGAFLDISGKMLEGKARNKVRNASGLLLLVGVLDLVSQLGSFYYKSKNNSKPKDLNPRKQFFNTIISLPAAFIGIGAAIINNCIGTYSLFVKNKIKKENLTKSMVKNSYITTGFSSVAIAGAILNNLHNKLGKSQTTK